jgi:hypothetical protein
MRAKNVQVASIVLSGLLMLMALSDIPLLRSKSSEIALLILAYVSLLIAVASTVLRYRNEHSGLLPKWRRIPYALSLTLMAALSLSPLVTWGLALGWKYPSPASRNDPIFFILFGANVAAVTLIWFGRGWSRVGLAVLNLILFLFWAFPMSVGI